MLQCRRPVGGGTTPYLNRDVTSGLGHEEGPDAVVNDIAQVENTTLEKRKESEGLSGTKQTKGPLSAPVVPRGGGRGAACTGPATQCMQMGTERRPEYSNKRG